jgi:outer membrane receptor protein involved in Fe transport
LAITPGLPQAASSSPPDAAAVVVELEGSAEFTAKGQPPWRPLVVGFQVQPGEQVRVAPRSRLLLRMPDQSTIRFSEGAEFRLEPGNQPKSKALLNLFKGVLYLFHRDEPATIGVKHRSISAAIRGTEFAFRIVDDGSATLTLLDGEVELSNEMGSVQLKSGEQATASPARAPSKTAAITAVKLIQWCLYYPAVLDVDELGLPAPAGSALEKSIAAYRQGDLLQALAQYPRDHEAIPPAQAGTASDAAKVYYAELLLAVGHVSEAESVLASLTASNNESTATVAAALRRLIRVVTAANDPELARTQFTDNSATAWMVESYRQQAAFDLAAARRAAGQAVERSPEFGFGWARLAELEFSFGRIGAARQALETALRLAPRNAQAMALRGFLLAAELHLTDAEHAFDRAIVLDGALGNAWLGRGLCRIRRGQREAGRDDIQVAVTLEPQRALLRSYLGKAWNESGERGRARQELRLAKQFDPHDPTAWLYSALLQHEQNQLNAAVRDLELAQALGTNQQVYRSRLLLDQDRAVRSANLANIYQDAGLFDPGWREAGRAVSADPANYSAHWFLANAYAQLSDPSQATLRYETPRLTEYLLGNLLAPADAGLLSSTISQQEFSRLLVRDHIEVISSTEYLSRGAWSEAGAVAGLSGRLSYALEGNYRWDPGQYANNDFEQTALSLQAKAQVSARDNVYAQVIYAKTDSGDTAFQYDPANVNPSLRVEEWLEPVVLGGYHHEWAPGVHSLVLAGRVWDRLELTNAFYNPLLLSHAAVGGPVTSISPIVAQQRYENQLAFYTAEAQQIFQTERLAFIVGGRFQTGANETGSRLDIPTQLVTNNVVLLLPSSFFDNPPQQTEANFERWTAYGYAQWQVLDSLRLLGGVSWDRLRFPENFRLPPVAATEQTDEDVLPKAGVLWRPARDTTLRAAYSQSLGGMSLDQSFSLEPTQIAGINQAWRSLIPESLAGSIAGAQFKTWGAALDQGFSTGTYLGLSAEWLQSEAQQTVGVYESSPPFVPPFINPSSTRESLHFDERRLSIHVHQLVAREWSFGLGYRLSQAELDQSFPQIPASAGQFGGFSKHSQLEAILHQVTLNALYNHPSGYFGQAQALFYAQDNRQDAAGLDDDQFWQLNLFAGYRFPGRRAELRLGLLNVTSQDYRLNPLNVIAALPRERTFFLGLKINF